jgi:hypothetical protein
MKPLILALCLLVSACGGGGSSDSAAPAATPAPKVNPTGSVVFDYSKFVACQSSTCAGDLVSKFHVDNFYWNSSTVYDESVLPAQGMTAYNLWRPVFEIQLVHNRTTGAVYTAGSDYQIVNGQFFIPAGSTIPQVPANWIHTSLPNTPAQYKAFDKLGNPLRISDDYQQNQITITYSSPQFNGNPPVVQNPPTKFMGKLRAGQGVTITWIGDSITVGADSTGALSLPPNQPGYVDLVTGYLSQKYPGQIYSRNKAVAGMASDFGAAQAPALLGDTPSDLVVIAWGMNDAALPFTADQFKANIQVQINQAKAVNPDVEILLVSSWPGNPDWQPMTWPPFGWYNGDMYSLQYTVPSVSVANVTSAIWDTMLPRKAYYDVTGNGANHPNDFVYVVYAQVVLKSLLNL